MARAYADHGIASVFFYTREAHPGERYPAHRSLEQKLAHARDFRDRFEIARPILVDDLIGTGHRAFGMLPNMTYLIGRGGRTDAATIQAALDYVVAARARRREGLILKPFYAESVGFRWSDQAAFDAGLELAGPQAVADFARAMQRWRQAGKVLGRVEIGEAGG
jgi:hypothetical protein